MSWGMGLGGIEFGTCDMCQIPLGLLVGICRRLHASFIENLALYNNMRCSPVLLTYAYGLHIRHFFPSWLERFHTTCKVCVFCNKSEGIGS